MAAFFWPKTARVTVTTEDVRRVAREVIRPDNRVVLTFVPDEAAEAAA